ncbi:hypothetical protein G3I59_32715 [Amycolatopsis rubida]|uniref:Uncharacterized protein n=1 Tax=Amycolatopsis rubida TaxID=112413 RepID=A0ABX0C5T1_9PSEU|nr:MULTISPECIES: hypothetical protein [Amycolatopsis]MYW95235.1 hypothetical protein [Amycolatopsis rubida]NEC60223.1 hypothetical protein [Amycolatopsis rubida]
MTDGDFDRPTYFTSRSVSTLLAILVVAFGLVSFSPPVDQTAQSASLTPAASTEPPCDPAAVMNRRLDELGRGGFTWTLAEPSGGLWGVVDLRGTMQACISEAGDERAGRGAAGGVARRRAEDRRAEGPLVSVNRQKSTRYNDA